MNSVARARRPPNISDKRPSHMSEQLSLIGFDPPPKRTDRLFFAIFPDTDTAARMGRLTDRLRTEQHLRGRPLDATRLHVTLHHVGDYAGLPEQLVDQARDAAAMVAMLPFDVCFNRVASFRRSQSLPLVLRGDEQAERGGLMSFQQALGQAMTQVGLGRMVNQRYTPHVTLLYDDRNVAEHPVEPINWTVREFVLVHSLLGQHRHVPLGRWPLRG